MALRSRLRADLWPPRRALLDKEFDELAKGRQRVAVGVEASLLLAVGMEIEHPMSAVVDCDLDQVCGRNE